MNNERLAKFRAEYILDKEKLEQERSAIYREKKVPDVMLHRWCHELYCLLSDNEDSENAELYLETIYDFISTRLLTLNEVGDCKNAFDLIYTGYFYCLEFMDADKPRETPSWLKLEKFALENIERLSPELSDEEQIAFLYEFMSEAEDLVASGNHLKVPAEPYFHFLTLPWSDNVKKIIPKMLDEKIFLHYDEEKHSFIIEMYMKFFPDYFPM